MARRKKSRKERGEENQDCKKKEKQREKEEEIERKKRGEINLMTIPHFDDHYLICGSKLPWPLGICCATARVCT